MSDVTIHEKEMYVIAVPIIMTLALTLLPKEFLETLPQFLQYLFSSPVATASIVAILLQGKRLIFVKTPLTSGGK